MLNVEIKNLRMIKNGKSKIKENFCCPTSKSMPQKSN